MPGATSLVELILKKWGDDIAGAAKELEEKVGFPESVANRIATGELPMDAESVARRADEQGYGDTLFRGHNSKKNPATSSDDMWMTDSPATAQTYADAINADYAPEAPGFEGWYSYYKEGDISDVKDSAELESLKNEYDGFLSKWNSSQPEPPGVVTPLRHNATDLAPVRGDGKHFESVQTNSNKLKGLQANPETKGIHRGTDNIAEAVRDSGSYQGTLFKGVKDDFEVGKGTQKSDVYNILGSRPDVNIRHADAAFDPEYTGSNIMGGAALPVAAGLLAAGQSDDADASVVTPAIKSLLKTVGDADADRIAKEIEGGWFVHNTDKFDAPVDPARFGQDIEPSGQYITPTSGARDDLPENLIQGQKDFQNPLMLKSSGNYQNPENWKRQLSDMYGGATGQDLSDAVRADGYDGIYTLETGPRGSYLSESVDLNVGKAGSRIEGGNADPRLLAGTAAGTAGLLAAPALMKDGVFQHGATSEPVVERKEPVRNQSSLLESVTDFGDEVIKSAKHAAGPLSLLVPFEGINDYLKVVNDYDRQPTWMDRLGLLDF